MKRISRDIVPAPKEDVVSDDELVFDPATAGPEEIDAFVSAITAELEMRDDRIAALEEEVSALRVRAAAPAPGTDIAERVGSEVTAIIRAAEETSQRLRVDAEAGAGKVRADAETVAHQTRADAEAAAQQLRTSAEEGAKRLLAEAEADASRARTFVTDAVGEVKRAHDTLGGVVTALERAAGPASTATAAPPAAPQGEDAPPGALLAEAGLGSWSGKSPVNGATNS